MYICVCNIDWTCDEFTRWLHSLMLIRSLVIPLIQYTVRSYTVIYRYCRYYCTNTYIFSESKEFFDQKILNIVCTCISYDKIVLLRSSPQKKEKKRKEKRKKRKKKRKKKKKKEKRKKKKKEKKNKKRETDVLTFRIFL